MLCFALDLADQERTGFRYHYSFFQVEYSRNLLFTSGQKMDRVFGALIDRVRGPLDLRTVNTLFGRRRRPMRHKGQPRAPVVEPSLGPGKSYLACALGHQACRLGISTRYYRVSRLLDELALARGDGSYPKVIQRLARTWLLILDDWGLASLSGQGRHDLLEVLDDRYARRGTLLASQVPVEHWHEVVGDPTFGDAILDRLLNNAHRIDLRGASMRRLYDSTKEIRAVPGDA